MSGHVTSGSGRGPWRYRLYGIELASDRPFDAPVPERSTSAGDRAPDLRLRWHGPGGVPADPPGERLWASPIRLSSGVPAVTLHRSDGGDRIRYTEVVDFLLSADGRRIDCRILDAALDHLVEIYLFGTVLAYWLERTGRLALHGSGVVVEGRAVAFLGSKGSGKSSLAASFLREGSPLLSDDLLAVDTPADGSASSRPSRPVIATGYPQLRMWPDLARHFVGDPGGLPTVEPGGRKRRVVLPDHWDAPFADAPAPLDRIYLPERREDGDEGGIRIEPVRGAEAVFGLVRESFLVGILQATGLQEDRLERLGRLVRHVPVRRLIYPPGLDRLPEVTAAVRSEACEGSGVASGSDMVPDSGSSSAGGSRAAGVGP